MNSTQNNISSASISASNGKNYDNVMIAGDGIGGLVFAGRLAQSERFAGRVTVVAPKGRPISRRLILGCSLRGSAVAPICQGLDIDRDTFLDAVFQSQSSYPACSRATLAMWKPNKNGKPFSPYGEGSWLGGSRGNGTPYAYSTRNQQITTKIRQFAENLPIEFIERKVESLDDLKSMATDKTGRTLYVNATGNPTLFGAPAKKPTRMCFAVQGAFRVGPEGLRAPLASGEIHAPFVRRNGIINVGFLTPFSDPLNPTATWYAILSRPVVADSGYDKDQELKTLTDELLAIAKGGGLIPVDPDETLAAALVPGGWFLDAPKSAPGTIELKQLYSAGVPTYFADGMSGAALSGITAADAVLKGRSPDADVIKMLRPFRASNYLHWTLMGPMSGMTNMILRAIPSIGSKLYAPQHRLWQEAFA